MTKTTASLDVALESTTTRSAINEPASSPRISFSADFLDDIAAVRPSSPAIRAGAAEFEFLAGGNSRSCSSGENDGMITADELFFEGKLLPFWQAHHAEKLAKIRLGAEKSSSDHILAGEEDKITIIAGSEHRNSVANPPNTWFVDDDPSPRPPKCTVLWKELLRLKKQRSASVLSPSSSSSSSNSSGSDDVALRSSKGSGSGRKGLERTRSATIRIRPMINVPICSQVKSSVASSHYALPPLFPLKKGKLVER